MSGPEPIYVKCLTAGVAGSTADLVTFPLDVAKVRLQIQGERVNMTGARYSGIFGTLLTMVRNEGPRSIYNGLVPGLQRQMCFSSIRIGLYNPVKLFFAEKIGGSADSERNIFIRILAGMSTGSIAVIIAQPTDVVKVRMQADSSQGSMRRYKSSIQAYYSIATTEGRKGLWKGTVPNVGRTSIINAGELVCYDYVKEFLIRSKILSDNVVCHFASGFVAGFCATVVASPLDVVKTRIMNSEPGYYKSMFHCAGSMYRESGVLAFYKGFMPSFVRLGAWNIVLFVTFEQLKRLVGQYYGNPTR
ncbi:UCP3 [Cordylochernes scorpioides]|uniref:UCP3 n=1 Tax=Cordylochernes scorpioides TaxID=51811 RepID=A0ABY6KI49_9ARAC|nr:UCP3 [Cordylochernes scorpioides]